MIIFLKTLQLCSDSKNIIFVLHFFIFREMALEAFLWDHGVQDEWIKGRGPSFRDFEEDKLEVKDVDMLRNINVSL